MTEELYEIKKQLLSAVAEQMNNLQSVNTHELGEAIDMIKDLAEAEYYCKISEAMDSKGETAGTESSEMTIDNLKNCLTTMENNVAEIIEKTTTEEKDTIMQKLEAIQAKMK